MLSAAACNAITVASSRRRRVREGLRIECSSDGPVNQVAGKPRNRQTRRHYLQTSRNFHNWVAPFAGWHMRRGNPGESRGIPARSAPPARTPLVPPGPAYRRAALRGALNWDVDPGSNTSVVAATEIHSSTATVAVIVRLNLNCPSAVAVTLNLPR